MNIQDAYHVLGIPENSSSDDIQSKYNELYNDYQIRLTNAPTPNLKKLYQKNLEELNDALSALRSDAVQSDLPSSGPVFNHVSQSKRTSEPLQQPKPKVQNARTTQTVNNNKKMNLNPVIIGAAIAIIGIATAAFFGMKFMETEGKLQEYGNIKLTNDSLMKFNRYFTNSKFKVQNMGKLPMTIVNVIVYYRNNKSELEKYVERDINKVIGPSAIDSLNTVDGNKVIWDGSVISYYFKFMYNNEPNHWSGLWVKDAQENGVFQINPE